MNELKGFKKTGIIILGLVAVFLPPLSASEEMKKVLLLNSYSRDYQWTEDVSKGVTETLSDYEDLLIDLHIEYLDSKKHSSIQYLESLNIIQSLKMKHSDYDLIITSDNIATDFVLENHSDIYKNIPLIFCGINGFNNYGHYFTDNSTGVLEEVDFINTLDLAYALQPDLEKYYVITDMTTTGKAIKVDLLSQVKQSGKRYNIEWIDNISIYELQNKISKISMNNAIILTLFNKDNSGETFSHIEAASKITEYSQAPVYSVWDFYMNHGIIGGYLTKGYTQGREAASIAIKYLEGSPINEIDFIETTEKDLILDYVILKKYGISLSWVPEKAVIINKPEMFLSKYRYYLFVIMISFLLIMFVVVYFVYSFTRKSFTLKQLKNKINEHKKTIGLLHEIFNEFPEMIYYKDSNGLYTFCNEMFSQSIFGLSPDQVINKNPIDLQTNVQIQNSQKDDQEILETREKRISREHIICIDQKERIFQMYKIPIINKLGSVSGILGLLIDHTNLVEREKIMVNKISILENQIQKIIIKD